MFLTFRILFFVQEKKRKFQVSLNWSCLTKESELGVQTRIIMTKYITGNLFYKWAFSVLLCVYLRAGFPLVTILKSLCAQKFVYGGSKAN